jgi:hypothetical protein
MAVFQKHCGTSDEHAIADLICNLGHLADERGLKLSGVQGADSGRCEKTAARAARSDWFCPRTLLTSVSNGASARVARALRLSISFGKKLLSRVTPSYYLESLLCNAPTEAFSNKRVTRPKAHVRALVHSKRPFRKGL